DQKITRIRLARPRSAALSPRYRPSWPKSSLNIAILEARDWSSAANPVSGMPGVGTDSRPDCPAEADTVSRATTTHVTIGMRTGRNLSRTRDSVGSAASVRLCLLRRGARPLSPQCGRVGTPDQSRELLLFAWSGQPWQTPSFDTTHVDFRKLISCSLTISGCSS